MYIDVNMMEQVISAEVSANAKLVFLVILYHANQKKGEAFPSWNLLGRETGLCRSSIARSIAQLVEARFIEKKKRARRNGVIYKIFPLGRAGKHGRHGMENRMVSQGDGVVSQRDGVVSQRDGGGVSETLVVVSQRHPNKSIEQKQSTQATTLFEEFWKKYPEKCLYKVNRERCKEKYAEYLDEASDPIRFHQEVIEGLERWRRSEMWNTENGRYICAPFNWLDHRSWGDAPAPKVEPEKMEAEAETKQKIPARPDWILCRERCRNCTGNGCGKGITVPPGQSIAPFPPEECRHFSGFC